MKDIEIAPSILAADFGYLMRDIKAVEKNAEYLHIDVMDGHYVNNISFGIPVYPQVYGHEVLYASHDHQSREIYQSFRRCRFRQYHFPLGVHR